jgi:Kef-type K+ transport system membrane component KefB
MPWKQSAIVGVALNSRGAMEIILATIAKDAGLIDDRLFVALTIMALVTSVLSGPIMSRLNSSDLAVAKYCQISKDQDKSVPFLKDN